MKTSALFVAAVSAVLFSAGLGLANDAANPTLAAKPGEHIGSTSGAHPSVSQAPSSGNNKSKPVQPHNAPPSSLPKSSLPVNAGQKHGVAVLGGAGATTAHKGGVLNGTEMKRSP